MSDAQHKGGMRRQLDQFDKFILPHWSALAADLGAEPHVISILLGHKNVGGQLTAMHSKSRYRREHAEALHRLADHIDAIENGVSDVTVLRRA